MDKPAIHNIRLSFSFEKLLTILSASSNNLINNKDLEIRQYTTDTSLKD